MQEAKIVRSQHHRRRMRDQTRTRDVSHRGHAIEADYWLPIVRSEMDRSPTERAEGKPNELYFGCRDAHDPMNRTVATIRVKLPCRSVGSITDRA